MFNKNYIECEVCLKKSNLKRACFCPDCGNDLITQFWTMEQDKIKKELKKSEENLKLVKEYLYILPDPLDKKLYYNRFNKR